MRRRSKTPQVLVVGAGPVGLLAALSLVSRGIDVQVVDKRSGPVERSYALALHPESMGLLNRFGLLEELLQQAYRVSKIGLREGSDRKAEIRINEVLEDFSFVAVLPQHHLERQLERALAGVGVKVSRNHRLSRLEQHENGVEVTLDRMIQEPGGYAVSHLEWVVGKSRTFEVPFVIGADGYRSLVRRQLGIEFDGVGPTHCFAVIEFESGLDLQHEMTVAFHAGSTNALWPLPDGVCRWSLQLDESELPEIARAGQGLAVDLGLEGLSEERRGEFEQLVARRAPWFSGRLDRVRWTTIARFEQRLVDRFGENRVWLAGDAGHFAHPVGSVSMNVGLREADLLAAAIQTSLGDGNSPAPLDTYNRTRLVEWDGLIRGAAEPIPGLDSDPWVRSHADRILPCIPASGSDLEILAAQLGLRRGSARQPAPRSPSIKATNRG